MRLVLPVAFTLLAALAGAQTKTVIGRLGRAKAPLQVFATPSSKGKVLSHVETGQYLVIRPNGSDWTPIVLQNSRLAYVPTKQVEPLPYEVTAKNNQVVRPSASTAIASRGGNPRMSNSEAAVRQQMAVSAMQFKTPYKWGGNDLSNGIDCSGFVKKMYGAIGYSLPRTAAEQALVGQPITRLEDLRSGDRLYFWETKRAKIGHTGIYVGGGYFVHSSSGHKGVATDFLSERWRKILVAARR